MVSLLFGVCIHRESILASRAEVPEGYTLLYRANQPGGNGDKDDGYDHHAEDEYNWMDVDEDGSHAQKPRLRKFRKVLRRSARLMICMGSVTIRPAIIF